MNIRKLNFLIAYLFFFLASQSYSQSSLPLIPQLKLWLRADTLVTLNVDSTLSSWKDLINGTVFSPPTSPMSPRLKADDIEMNKKAYANFNGSNGMVSQSNIALKNRMTTVLMVGKLNAITLYGYWLCYGVNSSGSWNIFEVKNSGRLAFFNGDDNQGAGVDGGGNPAGNTTVLDKHPAIVMSTVNPTNAQWMLYENFINKHSGFSGPFTQAASNPVSIGYRTDGALYANFRLAEVMLFDSTLSTTQLNAIKSYLQDRYSERVDLGADITVPYGFCSKSLTISNPRFVSYLWSTGDTSKTVSIKKSGTYWVDATDMYGFHSTDTIKVTYPAINSITNNAMICPGNSLLWDTHLSKKHYSFKWQDNSTDSVFNINQAGKYYVTVTDTSGCFLTSDSITIKLDNISNVISLGNDTTFCSGNTIGLKTGASQVSSYLWSTGSTASTLVVSSSGKYWVTVKSVNNCSASDTINVIVSGTAPTSNFSFSNTCFKNSTAFTDLSTVSAGETLVSWSWNFGDSQSSALQNPVHVYADTGQYVVQLKVTTASNCASVISKTIHIYPAPDVNFQVSNGFINSNASFTSQAQTYGYPITQWSWNFGDPASGASNLSALQNPFHTFANAGNYNVKLIAVNNQGCSDTLAKTIGIVPKPSSLPQLKLWLRADTLVTLNIDSTLSSWKDLINGTVFSPPTSPMSPRLKADDIEMNKKAYVNFNGSNGMVSQSNIALKNRMTTVLMVGKLNAITVYGYWLCYGVNGNGSWNIFEVKNSGRLAFFNGNDNQGAGVDGGGNPAGNTTVLDKHPAIVMSTVNPTNAQWMLYENFINKHSGFSGPFTQAASNPVSIGYRTDGTLFGNFRLAEVMLFDSTLSTTQLNAIKSYLQDRYSERVDLGADITVPYGFCGKSLTISNPRFVSYLWSTGDTSKTVSIKKSGTYWVDVTDMYGFHSTDTIKITYPAINSLANATICSGNSLLWDTHLSKKHYSFKWQDNSTDSVFNINQAGKYYVTVTDTSGCFMVSDTATIKLDNISNVISLGNDTTFCSGNTIGLKTGASQVSSYLWSTGSTASTLAVSSSGKYWVTVKSVNNCSASDTINVIVSGTAPTSNFSFSNTCFKNSTAFTDLSTVSAGETLVSWSWNFGDSQSSALQNPVHVYADTGQYVVQLKVTTASNCASVISKTIHIYPAPDVNFQVSNGFINSNASFTSQAQTYGYSITQWSWNFGDPASGASNLSALQNPFHTFANAGNYNVKLIAVNNQGCSDTLAKIVPIIPKPSYLSQLKLWLRADTLMSLNADSTISSWKDLINGTVFSPPTSPMSPRLKADEVEMNKRAYANFNGSNGMVSQSNIALRNNMTTVLMVGELNAITLYGYWLCYGVNTTGSWNIFEVKNSGRLAFFDAFENAGAGLDPSGNPAGNTTVLDKHPAMVMATVNPANFEWNLYENFSNKHTAFTLPFKQASSNPVSIGYRTDGTLFGNFKLAEVMLFDSTLSTSQLNTIKNYLQDRYSERVDLGADVTVPYSLCSKNLTISNPKFISYLWSTGDTSKTISIKKSGTYWVNVTDIYGFHSRDTIKVIYPSISSIASATICPGNNLLWDTHLSKKYYSFKWQDNSTDSVFNINQAGKYYVTVTDTSGCFMVSDTATIKLDNISNVISLGNDTTFCSGNTIGLKTGASQVSSYLWSTGSINTTIPIQSTGDYWLTVKSANNCLATDTIHVIVNGVAPSSNFSFLNTCLKNTTVFTDLSTPPVGETIATWSWNFGDSFTSSVPSPVHVYADTGKYTVQLLVTTPAGCSQLHTKTINIYTRPKVNFAVTNLCEDVNTIFTGQVTTYGYPVSKWSWDFADPTSGPKNTSALQNPVHLFGSGGTYPVRLIVENNKGCTDTLVKNVIINPSPVTDFSFSLACKDDTVQFKDLTTLPAGTTNAGNYWSFGNGTSTLLNPTHVFPASVKYTVMHIVTASNGCKDTMIKSVDVHASPTARFVNSTSCESSPTLFTDQSFIPTGTVTGWQWTFENTGQATIKNPQYTFIKTGNVIVKQVVISDFGCKDSISKIIVVYPRPVAQFTVTPEYGNPGQSVKFTNTSTGAVTYSWDFDDGGTSKLVNPTHIYNDTGSYVPSLIATSSVGCNDTAFGKVLILKRFMDVAITGIKAEVQNGGGVLLNDYLNVHVDLVNRSTADVFALDLYMETNDGPAIKESWSGKFLKGDVMGYDFKSAPNLKAGDHFVCVYALNPNGLKDEVPADNKWCEALDVSEFKVIAPYPNPTEDLLIVPLIIPKAGELTMTIYDSRGKEVQKPYSGSIAHGLQQITVYTREFNSGLYVCKVQLDEQTIFTKFIKK